jgi:hypothetical protein
MAQIKAIINHLMPDSPRAEVLTRASAPPPTIAANTPTCHDTIVTAYVELDRWFQSLE